MDEMPDDIQQTATRFAGEYLELDAERESNRKVTFQERKPSMTSPRFILSILPYCLVIGIVVGVLRWVGMV